MTMTSQDSSNAHGAIACVNICAIIMQYSVGGVNISCNDCTWQADTVLCSLLYIGRSMDGISHNHIAPNNVGLT